MYSQMTLQPRKSLQLFWGISSQVFQQWFLTIVSSINKYIPPLRPFLMHHIKNGESKSNLIIVAYHQHYWKNGPVLAIGVAVDSIVALFQGM